MSFPLGLITPTPVTAEFLPPLDEEYTPLEEAVLGGIAIGDGSQGRALQRWTVAYDAGSIKVANEAGVVGFTMAVANVLTVSLAFDNNMAVAIAYTTPVGAHLYYFNAVSSTFTTLTVPGADSARVCVDDPRRFNNAASDVIFAYTLDSNLYYRIQRERYVTERLIGTSNGLQLLRAGPTSLNRLQFKLGTYIPPL